MNEKDHKQTVVIEIEFDKPVRMVMVPLIVDNRDAVQILGANILNVRCLEETT